jgi:hypothetical protein
MADSEPEQPVPRPEPLVRPQVAPRHRGVRPVFLLLLALGVSVAALVFTLRRHGDATPQEPQTWFEHNRAHCNSVEALTFLEANDPGRDADGMSYRATCLALAGKITAARETIVAMPVSDRDRAVNFMFGVAHPVADMGDDESAGPIMALVVEFQPDQYMALYHAGMAKAVTGDDARARELLGRFLEIYRTDDGWTANARRALQSLDRPRAQRTVERGHEGSVIY